MLEICSIISSCRSIIGQSAYSFLHLMTLQGLFQLEQWLANAFVFLCMPYNQCLFSLCSQQILE